MTATLLIKNLAPLEPFLTEEVSNLYINRPQEIVIEEANGMRRTEIIPECSGEWMEGMSMVLASQNGQAWQLDAPLPSCRLPGGHRMQMVMGSWVVGRYALAIRVHRQKSVTLEDFGWNYPSHQKDVLQAIAEKKTILVAGSTGAGKTTMLSAMLKHIPEDTRLVVIEDVEELHVPHANKVHLICSQEKEGIGGKRESRAMLSAALRLNPDRIVVGEIRQHTASTFFRAIHSGHPGSFATIHAKNAEEALDACIDDMILQGDMAESGRHAARKRLERAVFGVVTLTRLKDKSLVHWETC